MHHRQQDCLLTSTSRKRRRTAWRRGEAEGPGASRVPAISKHTHSAEIYVCFLVMIRFSMTYNLSLWSGRHAHLLHVKCASVTRTNISYVENPKGEVCLRSVQCITLTCAYEIKLLPLWKIVFEIVGMRTMFWMQTSATSSRCVLFWLASSTVFSGVYRDPRLLNRALLQLLNLHLQRSSSRRIRMASLAFWSLWKCHKTSSCTCRP